MGEAFSHCVEVIKTAISSAIGKIKQWLSWLLEKCQNIWAKVQPWLQLLALARHSQHPNVKKFGKCLQGLDALVKLGAKIEAGTQTEADFGMDQMSSSTLTPNLQSLFFKIFVHYLSENTVPLIQEMDKFLATTPPAA